MRRRAVPGVPPTSISPLLSAAGALLLAAGSLCAQGPTGRIEGQVHDEVGSVIAEAQVYIPGTAFGAVTDPRGHYFLNHVPSGRYNLRATYLGHRPMEARDLQVLAGQTVIQDFALEAAPLMLRELEVVAAENLLVPRDEVTTKQRVQGDFVERLPVDRLTDVIALQPGVVASGKSGPLALSIRGGRPDEVVTYVDGVPVTPGFRGLALTTTGQQISVGTNAVQEASVTTGATSAEYGNTQSGVLSIVTRSGGSQFNGALAYQTDQPFGVSHSLGFNRVEASFGGPLARRLSFFLAGVLEGQRSAGSGRDSEKAPIFVSAGVDTTVTILSDTSPFADTTYLPVYRFAVARGSCDEFSQSANPGIRTNYGLGCQGIRTPISASSSYELTGKLTYTFGTGSQVGLSYLRSQHQERHFDYQNLYNSPSLLGLHGQSQVLTLNWTQNLARSAERALALEVYLSYQPDRSNAGPLAQESELATRDPFGGFMIRPLGFLFDFDNFPLDRALVENLRLNRPGTRRTPFDPENSGQYQPIDQYRNNAYGLRGWNEEGGPTGLLILHRETRSIGRANLDWQANRYSRLKAGAEVTRYAIDYYESNLVRPGDAYMERPIRWDGFVEHRLDLGSLVLVGGLRYDYYSSRASRPFLLDTVAASPSFGDYVNLPGANIYEAGGAFDGKPLVVFRPDRGHSYLSPHIQVAFPITVRTNFRFSYAHQVQSPDFALLLNGVNAGGLGADLDFGKTIAFEFGVRHAFSDDMVLDVAVYNRDHVSVASARTFQINDPVGQRRTTLVRVANADFGNARGVDLRLDRRFGNYFNGTISYSYQDAKSTGSDPLANQERAVAIVNAIGGIIGPPPQAILPTTLSRPHDLAGTVAITFPPDWKRGTVLGGVLGNLGLYATFRYGSGTAYTPCRATVGNMGVLSDEGGCPEFRGAANSARLPASKQFDLRVTKSFQLGRVGLTAYLDARNLFNFTNVLRVYSVTGSVVNHTEHAMHWTSDSALFASEAQASAAFRGDGAIDLGFAGAVASGCGVWVTADGRTAIPNCIYLIRAEERFGDGDHVFTVAEQRRASDAFYQVERGIQNFTQDPRRLRVGVELTF
jgi:Carboxypeptidase regulatory-like domain/TonB-dependent Receptor Plug Domain